MPTSGGSRSFPTSIPRASHRRFVQQVGDPVHLVAAGLNHKAAPVAVREGVYLDLEECARLLEAMRAGGVNEAAILSTCNRTEVYLAAGRPQEARDQAASFFRRIAAAAVAEAMSQGALAVQARLGDEQARAVAAAIEDAEARAAVDAERRLLAMLGAGCHTPIAVYCRRDPSSGGWVMDATLFSSEGDERAGARRSGGDPRELAGEVYSALMEAGAARLLAGR